MPLSGDSDPVRERLEALGCGLRELELLRRRQEDLVRAALELQQPEDPEEEEEEEEEEKKLEENILLLRKQLTCLRRRDAGLLSQLQELDRQLSELRLDTEESHLETDSRPSSGFYELSDGASGSLSNSSNSVFSECFCSTVDAEGRPPPTDDSSCLECDGLRDDPSSGPVRRSFSAPHPPPPALDPAATTVDAPPQSKYHCDLVSRNGGDVYRYPSPLHAVAVQSPAFFLLQTSSHGRDEAVLKVGANEADSAPVVPQSSSWPATSSSSCQRRLDSYILGLLQRRVQPIRTSRPRTSISADPSKSVLRHASLCVRQVSSGSGAGFGFGTLRASELQPALSVASRGEEHEPQNGGHVGGGDAVAVNSDSAHVVLDLNKKRLLPSAAAAATATLPKDFREVGGAKVNPAPKPPCFPADQEPPLRDGTRPPARGQTEAAERSEVRSSSPSQDEAGGDAAAAAAEEGGGGHVVTAKSDGAAQKVKPHKNLNGVKVKMGRAPERREPAERRADRSKKPRPLDATGGSAHIKASRRSPAPAAAAAAASSRGNKHLPASDDKHATSTAPSNKRSGVPKHHHHGNHHHHSSHHHHHHHHHHHGRDQVVVVAKPKHKRSDYRRLHRLRAIMEASPAPDEAFRRARQRQRKELPTDPPAAAAAATEQLISPYCYAAAAAARAGSDSEYSAECASLFHSTIVDTSEDERSNYTANRFGDSESSEDEYVEESSSDTEESGGGGCRTGGRGRSQTAARAAAGQEVTRAQASKAVVKIKASHNLKKKILRFRSGSLKLMTTV